MKNFESVSNTLMEALSACYPLDKDFLDLMAAEERIRATVMLARIRLINRWRDSLEDEPDVNPASPDHIDPS